MSTDPAEWVRAELPGSPLVLTLDAGGERWTCAHILGRDGVPVPAGDWLELLTEGATFECARCEGTGGALHDGGGPVSP